MTTETKGAAGAAKAWQKLTGQQCMYRMSPKIEGMMTGVEYARQHKDGDIELVYVDGTTERAACPEVDIGDLRNMFAVVSLVQGRARAVQS